MMNSDDIALLQRAGNAMVVNLSYVVESATLFGIFLAIALTSLFTYIRHRTQEPGAKLLTRSTVLTLSWLFVVFALMTILYASTISSNVGVVKDRFINNPELEFVDRYMISSANAMKASLLSNWIAGQGGLLFLVGDSVVVWRAWIICNISVVHQRARMLIFIPLFLLLATLAFSVASSALLTQAVGGTLIVSNVSTLGILTITAGACSLATNVAATSIIGFIAYHYRKEILQSIGLKNSRAWRPLLYLLETGVIYSLLQAVYLTLVLLVQVPGGALDLGAKFMQNLFIFASASYPFFILLIKTHQRTFADDVSQFGPNGTKIEPGSHISFATSRPKRSAGGSRRVNQGPADSVLSAESFGVTTYTPHGTIGVASMVQSSEALGGLVPVQISEDGKRKEDEEKVGV